MTLAESRQSPPLYHPMMSRGWSYTGSARSSRDPLVGTNGRTNSLMLVRRSSQLLSVGSRLLAEIPPAPCPRSAAQGEESSHGRCERSRTIAPLLVTTSDPLSNRIAGPRNESTSALSTYGRG